MVDLDKIDKMYEASKRLWGKPIRIAIFDKRVLMPVDQLVERVAIKAGENVTDEKLKRWADAELFPLLPRDGDPADLGFPLYVPSRIELLLHLERAGWTGAELHRVAQIEEWTIDCVLTTDELTYEDDEVKLVSAEIQMLVDRDAELLAYLEADPRPSRPPSYWDPEATPDALRDRCSTLRQYLQCITAPQLSEARRENIARTAFRTRARHEAVRRMLLNGDRARLRQGFSPWVTFREHQYGPEGFSFKGIMWDLTVCAPALDEEEEPLPIRLPGLILRGEEVTLARALTPHEYERLWREYQLNDYFRARAKVREERICQHCLKPLPEEAKPTKLYCSEACRSAARMQRFRQNSPDKQLAIQERYWADDE